MNRAARPMLLWLAAPLALALSTAATAQQPSKEFLQGTHAFRFVLHDRHFSPLTEFGQLTDDPSRAMLIVFGDTSVLEYLGVMRFVQSGGALLVASDRKHPDVALGSPTWKSQFGVEFVEQPVIGLPRVCYQGLPECPFVIPVSSDGPPLFEFLKNPVATNRAGFLRCKARKLHTIARFPRNCESERATEIMEQAGYLPFAVAGQIGRGRILILADHSVFINNMMLQDDTGNVDFTYNCLEWLRSGGEERRDRVLFYDESKLVTDFNVPVKMPPPGLPQIDDPVALADQLIAGLEDENMHNKLLLDAIGYERLLKWLAIGLTAILAVFGFVRLVRSRHRLDVAAPLLAPTLAKLAPVGAGLAHRHRALLAEGNLWEPARALAREFFETALRTHEPPAGPEPPPFEASESWLTRRAVRKQVLYLWRLAYGNLAVRIVPGEFARLAAQVDELKAALADGTLRFAG